MTPAQKQVRDKIDELLREHFSASVLVTQVESGDTADVVDASWHGGYPASIGLLEIAKLRVWHAQSTPPQAPDGTDDVPVL